jgi:hypothetical protein
MHAGDVTTTLEDSLAASGCDSATVAHRPRLGLLNDPVFELQVIAGDQLLQYGSEAAKGVRRQRPWDRSV